MVVTFGPVLNSNLQPRRKPKPEQAAFKSKAAKLERFNFCADEAGLVRHIFLRSTGGGDKQLWLVMRCLGQTLGCGLGGQVGGVHLVGGNPPFFDLCPQWL